jgi:hypothetical protein
LRWLGSDHLEGFRQLRRLNVPPPLIDVFNYELHRVVLCMLLHKEGLENESARSERQNSSAAVRKYSVNSKPDVLIKTLAEFKILRRYEGAKGFDGEGLGEQPLRR